MVAISINSAWYILLFSVLSLPSLFELLIPQLVHLEIVCVVFRCRSLRKFAKTGTWISFGSSFRNVIKSGDQF